jgi:hypothetical protein
MTITTVINSAMWWFMVELLAVRPNSVYLLIILVQNVAPAEVHIQLFMLIRLFGSSSNSAI